MHDERQARRQTEALLRFTEAMSVALTEEDVAAAVLRESLPIVGAAAGAVLRWAVDAPDTLEIIASSGIEGPAFAPWQRFPSSMRSPISDAVVTRNIVAATSIDEVAARYPDLHPLAAVTGFGAWLAVPFVAHDPERAGASRVLGGFGVAFHGAHVPSDDECALLLAMGRQAAQALARAHSYELATRARIDADRARTRAERLRDVVAALSGAPDVAAVYEVLVHEARVALGAHAGAVALFDAEREELRFVRWFGYPDGVMNDWIRVPLAHSTPLTDAVRQRTPLWVGSPEALAARWPDFVAGSQAVTSKAWAVLPMVIDHQPSGALALSFPEPRPADQALEAFSLALIGHCAQALERARLYDAERQSRAEAERANRAKGQFLSTLSHELRNPLHTIGCCAELLASREPLSTSQQSDLHRLLRANRHMATLVDTILDFARLDAGQMRFDCVRVGIRALLDDVEVLMVPGAEARGLSLQRREGDVDRYVWADPDKLRRILLNLVGNAIKFTELGGAIALEVGEHEAEGTVTITVRDTGCGIAPEWIERVFEPFVQIDRQRIAEALQGVGLGLTISRDLARGMDGSLRAESTPQVGSAFILTLPRAT